MAFDGLISGLVDTAFGAVGDLAKDVRIVNTSATSYNFATGATSTALASTVTIKGIIQGYDRPDPERPFISATVLFRTSDIGELDAYDRLEFEGHTWKLSTFEDNGYTVTATVVREV